jgi:hypothetical protein
MRKKGVVLSIAVFTISTLAQNPPPGTISHPPAPARGAGGELGAGNLSFTNRAGTVYSVNQLAGQLQSLHSAIEQALPMITAFTETYSNSMGGQQSMAGKLSGILSGVLNRNTTNSTVNQNAPPSNNVVGTIEHLLNTNSPAAAPVNTNAFQDLVALENYLQPTLPILQRLTSGGATNQAAPGELPATGR